MRGKGLSLELIVDTAAKLIEEKGCDNFSLRELSARLNVKAASLYNHIDSVEDINREVGAFAVGRLNDALSGAMDGKCRDDAMRAVAGAYRRFVKDNPELYRIVISLPILDGGDGLQDIRRLSLDVLRRAVGQYRLPDRTAAHYLRGFRSALHGFAALETAGYFARADVDVNESYRFMIDGYIDRLHTLETETPAEGE